jgi:hypothetical protein
MIGRDVVRDVAACVGHDPQVPQPVDDLRDCNVRRTARAM